MSTTYGATEHQDSTDGGCDERCKTHGEFLPGPSRAGKPSIRSNLLAVLCAFDSVAEALKILCRTVGELEEFREQVLDAVELDAELAGLEVDVRGQGGDLVAGLGAQGDFHGGGLEVFANAFELGHQPPTLLIAERLAVSNGFELRIPGQADHDSEMMPISVPTRIRSLIGPCRNGDREVGIG